MPDTAGESLGSAHPGLPEQPNEATAPAYSRGLPDRDFHGGGRKHDRCHHHSDDRQRPRRVQSVYVGVHRLPADPGGHDPGVWPPCRFVWPQAGVFFWHRRVSGRDHAVRHGLEHAVRWCVFARYRAVAPAPSSRSPQQSWATSTRRRNVAAFRGWLSSVFGVSAVVGPSLGAFLVQHIGWRAVFWVNVPIGLGAIVMIGVFLREEVHRRSHRIDWAGSLLLLLAFGCLMLAMVQSGTLGGATLTILTTIGVIALIALYLQERTTPEPMLPLELWRNRVIVVGSVGNFTAGAMMMGVAAFLPTYIQGAMGRPAVEGGLVLGAMSVTWALASLLAGRIMTRTSYRLVAILGGVALAAGCAMLADLKPADGPIWAAAGSLVIGIGMGFCSTVFIVSIQASVPWRQRGAATSSSHVHALRRPIDRRRNVWGGAERHDSCVAIPAPSMRWSDCWIQPLAGRCNRRSWLT